MNGDKKTIYFLIALIIFFAIILLVKIKATPNFDPKVYADIYNEYEDIFGENSDANKIDGIIIQNIEDNTINSENNAITTTANVEHSNVIGQIIIPKIDIKYPVIRETTTEYLKIAPTKYCGPEVNEVRKFSYSGA